MGYSCKVISYDKDIENSILIYSNDADFQTDVFRFLVEQQDFFRFDKIAAIKETIENLKFEPNKIYNLYGFSFKTFPV